MQNVKSKEQEGLLTLLGSAAVATGPFWILHFAFFILHLPPQAAFFLRYDTRVPKPALALRPRIRIVREDGVIVFGPGKADLLAEISAHGSIRRAAENLRMSYMRAWKLIRVMNDAFPEPLVAKTRGGAAHGGAVLTPEGEKVLALYRRMESKATRAMAAEWRRLKSMLR
jgi:molybdate transport system regulatory protein